MSSASASATQGQPDVTVVWSHQPSSISAFSIESLFWWLSMTKLVNGEPDNGLTDSERAVMTTFQDRIAIITGAESGEAPFLTFPSTRYPDARFVPVYCETLDVGNGAETPFIVLCHTPQVAAEASSQEVYVAFIWAADEMKWRPFVLSSGLMCLLVATDRHHNGPRLSFEAILSKLNELRIHQPAATIFTADGCE